MARWARLPVMGSEGEYEEDVFLKAMIDLDEVQMVIQSMDSSHSLFYMKNDDVYYIDMELETAFSLVAGDL